LVLRNDSGRFSINHGYRSSFTINQFQTNLDYAEGNGALTYQDQLGTNALNQNGDFKSRKPILQYQPCRAVQPAYQIGL